MKTTLLVLFVFFPALTLGADMEETDKKLLREARELVAPAEKKFLRRLSLSLQKNRPEKALDDCKLGEAGSKPGVQVDLGWTSVRLRNRANAPKTWMVPYLVKYSTLPVRNAQNAVLLKIGDNRWGYLEPLHIRPVCLKCHGKTITTPVRNAILDRYPEDLATGYGLSEFRGFVWAEITK
jgi:hypothetical protein